MFHTYRYDACTLPKGGAHSRFLQLIALDINIIMKTGRSITSVDASVRKSNVAEDGGSTTSGRLYES